MDISQIYLIGSKFRGDRGRGAAAGLKGGRGPMDVPMPAIKRRKNGRFWLIQEGLNGGDMYMQREFDGALRAWLQIEVICDGYQYGTCLRQGA